MKKLIDKFHLWHLMYRTEIVIFTIGFILGAVILLSGINYINIRKVVEV